MEASKNPDLTPEERQATIDKMVVAWKVRKKQLEQINQQQLATPEYQSALEELEKRRLLRGSRTVEI